MLALFREKRARVTQSEAYVCVCACACVCVCACVRVCVFGRRGSKDRGRQGSHVCNRTCILLLTASHVVRIPRNSDSYSVMDELDPWEHERKRRASIQEAIIADRIFRQEAELCHADLRAAAAAGYT